MGRFGKKVGSVSLKRSDYPALYRAADDASQGGQKTYKRLVKADLSMVVLASALGTVWVLFPARYGTVFAVVTAVVLLAILLAKLIGRQRRDDEDWFDGRAVAESVKTLTWRYIMRVEPFDEDATCDQEFARELDAIREARADLQLRVDASLGGSADQITERMREVRGLTTQQRRDLYARERLGEQAEWYGGKSRDNRILAEVFFWASLAAQFVALVLAIVRVAFPETQLSLVGPLLALAAAVTAWTQLGRHDELSKSYALANQELLTIKSLVDTVDTEKELAGLVRDGEGAISREHTMWVAKRSDPLPTRS
jgi:hypothetical protein